MNGDVWMTLDQGYTFNIDKKFKMAAVAEQC